MTWTEKLNLTRLHLENRSSYRTLSSQSNHDKRLINIWVQEVAAKARDDIWIAKQFEPTWSGILVVDGKWISTYDWTVKHAKYFGYTDEQLKGIHNQVLIWGDDYGTGDIPAHLVVDSEGKVDCVLYFEKLKETGYPLKVLVSDGNPNLIAAAEHVYGYPIIWQQCVRHFGQNIWKLARQEIGEHEAETEQLCKHICLMLNQKEYDVFHKRLDTFCDTQHRYQTSKQQEIKQTLWANMMSLIRHWEYPEIEIPRTNNAIENYNAQLNLRLHSIRQFRSHQNASDYIKLWILWRRFSPFTDCCKKNKRRNGRAPLELTGADLRGFDYLKL